MWTPVNRESSVSIYKQIEENIKKRILTNEFVYGTKLPSERRLAEILKVHRNTVIKAYKRLEDQELISSHFGERRGYFVIFDCRSEHGKNGRKKQKVFKYKQPLKKYERLFTDIYNASFDERYISFGGHIFPKEMIPLEEIKLVLHNTVDRYGADAFDYCSERGFLPLRKQLAKALQEKGIMAKPGEIVIINETTQGLEYVAKMLTEKNDYIVVENPVMPDMLRICRILGLQILPVPMEKDGMDLVRLENLIKKYSPKFVHTMPDCHGITGTKMSLKKRYSLLEIAERFDIPVVEERWYAGIDFSGQELPALFSLGGSRNVITIDDALSDFYYGARISYLLTSEEMAKMIGYTLNNAQIHLQSLEQAMFAEYLYLGFHDKQRDQMRRWYEKKYACMVEELMPMQDLGLTFEQHRAGLGIWCRLPRGVHDMRLYENLRNRNVLICPGKIFDPFGLLEECYMRLSYSNVSDNQIKEGMRIIYDELRNLTK